MLGSKKNAHPRSMDGQVKEYPLEKTLLKAIAYYNLIPTTDVRTICGLLHKAGKFLNDEWERLVKIGKKKGCSL